MSIPPDRYLWHLRPPWRDKFDHSAWWEGQKDDLPVVAGVWECFRRHPNVPDTLRKMRSRESAATFFEDFLWRYGRYVWPKLGTKREAIKRRQSRFETRFTPHFPSGHGLIRPPVTVLNDETAFEPISDPKTLSDLVTKQLSKEVLWRSDAGFIVLSVDPNAPIHRIVTDTKDKVESWRQNLKHKLELQITDPGKARPDQWLAIIEEFERAELTRKENEKRDHQLFARYRRIVQNWWPAMF